MYAIYVFSDNTLCPAFPLRPYLNHYQLVSKHASCVFFCGHCGEVYASRKVQGKGWHSYRGCCEDCRPLLPREVPGSVYEPQIAEDANREWLMREFLLHFAHYERLHHGNT